MAVADVLAEMPRNHQPAVARWSPFCGGWPPRIARVQDPDQRRAGGRSSTWPGGPETTRKRRPSAMFVYALTKGVKNGLVGREDVRPGGAARVRGPVEPVRRARTTRAPCTSRGICKVAGLGGDPYRDGSVRILHRDGSGRRTIPRGSARSSWPAAERARMRALPDVPWSCCSRSATRLGAPFRLAAGSDQRAVYDVRDATAPSRDGKTKATEADPQGDRGGGGERQRDQPVLRGQLLLTGASTCAEQHHASCRRRHGAEVLERFRRLPADGPLALGGDRGR